MSDKETTRNETPWRARGFKKPFSGTKNFTYQEFVDANKSNVLKLNLRQRELRSTTCFAHCALRSKLHYHLPRLAAAWGSGITGSGLSSPFPLLRSTQPYSDRAENFEANTHPYRIPPLLPSHTHLPPHLSSTGVF